MSRLGFLDPFGHFGRMAFVAVMILAAPSGARGDGAFPDAQNILLPVDRPAQIILPTNFGVVFTEDGGHSWRWTCEQDLNSFGWLYQIGLPPRRRIFAIANGLLVYSDDMTCGWHASGGALAGQEVADAWIDRAVPDRVLAVGARCCGAGGNNVYSVFASQDGGAIFGPPVYVAAAGDAINGIESSVSDPTTIYLALSRGPTFEAVLARSSDGGLTWQPHDLAASLGKGNARLIAVDPQDAMKVFLLWNDPIAGEAVAVTDDGGATVSIRIAPTGDGATVKAFVRTATGTVLVATDARGDARLYRSSDGGHRFDVVAGSPHIRGLAERGGLIYAATDNFADGFALATSADEGGTWRALMSYRDVTAIPGCLKAACADACALETPLLWEADVCSADASPSSAGGTSGGGGARGAGGGGAGGKGQGGRTESGRTGGAPPTGSGCGCRLAAAGGERGIGGWGMILAALVAVVSRSRRRASGRRSA